MIRVRQVKVGIEENSQEVLVKKISKKLGVSENEIFHMKLIKKSIDARDKQNLHYSYEVDVEVSNEEKVLGRNHSNDILPAPVEVYQEVESGSEELKERVVVVGSGPAGLFASYLLAERGYHPLILERGEKVEERIETVEKFFQENILNPNSNIQFGEGGAGTFSDGKLNTMVKDTFYRGKKVFEIFVECGAPEEIFYEQKPHIGTDILRKVIVNLRNRILEMGGEIHYQAIVTDILVENNKVIGVEVNHFEEIPCSAVVLAIGHSARDTFQMLRDHNMEMRQKNFAVGVRMEHPQAMINESQYGEKWRLLPPASYKLTYQTSLGRSVYSFCMCPGGFVVNASSEEGRLVVNGMSNYHRDEDNANSAIVVSVSPKDFGEDIFSGMEFQRRLEEKAYQVGKGFIPVQLYEDFVGSRESSKFGEVKPNIKGKTTFSNLNEILSKEICDSLKEAIPHFGKQIHGFDRGDALLYGVETRTSSPVVIVRDENYEASIKGIYPCGEGAGYAGGITTAAMDGVKVAEAIIQKYAPKNMI